MDGDDVYAVIGTNIRFSRQARSLSLEELAEMTGLTPAFLGQVERCDRKLSVAALAAVSDALCLTPNDLMGKGSKPRRTPIESTIASLLQNQPDQRKKIVLHMIKCLLRILRR